MMKRMFTSMIFFVMVFPFGKGYEPELVASDQTTPPAAAEVDLLYPQEMDLPSSCGVPLRVPFGQEKEIFLGPWSGNADDAGGYKLDQPAGWFPFYGESYEVDSDIAAVAVGSDKIVAVHKGSQCGKSLALHIWDSAGGWSTPECLPDLGLAAAPDGNPAIISRHRMNWEVYVRQGSKIMFLTWDGCVRMEEWKPMDGVANAASDPVAVAVSPNRTLHFYQDINGKLWFSEWNGISKQPSVSINQQADGQDAQGIWREKPVPLGEPKTTSFSTFLPITMGGNNLLQHSDMFSSYSIDASSEEFPIEPVLSAVSRNENHVAVFYVDPHGNLWVREWTSQNASDWKDTDKTLLMSGLKVEKPAVASRHSNHLGLVVRDASDSLHYIEWTKNTGWKAPETITNAIESHFILVATAIDKMSVFVITSDYCPAERKWTEEGGWGNFECLNDSTQIKPTFMSAAVVRKMDDVMLLGSDSTDKFISKHYTNQGRDVSQSQVMKQEFRAYPRGQGFVWVDGKTFWVGVGVNDSNEYVVSAIEPGGAGGEYTLGSAGKNPYASLEVVDIDGDNEDEIVIATSSLANTKISVLEIISITDPLEFDIVEYNLDSLTPDKEKGNIAVGDLDGDGAQNELVLARRIADEIQLDVLQYKIGVSPNLKYHSTFTFIGEFIAWDPEISIGKLDPSIKGDEVVLFSAETFNFELFSHLYSNTFMTLSKYRLNKDTMELSHAGYYYNHGFTESDLHRSPDLQFRLDVDSFDLNLDGIDEIVMTFEDIVIVIDPVSGQVHEKVFSGASLDFPHSIDAGDIDLDGRGEIVVSTRINDETRLFQLEYLDDGSLVVSGNHTFNPGGSAVNFATVLVGDLDGDTFIADLVGCKTFGEYRVVAVVNGMPRLYESGEPLFDSSGSYGKESSTGTGEEFGTSYNAGASLTVGFEQEFNVPLIGIKAGEVRASITQDIMETWGISEERETYQAYGREWKFSSGLGRVIYNLISSYTCNYYDAYEPDNPDDTSRVMLCEPPETCGENDTCLTTSTTLEAWHSDDGKEKAGGSWAPVGHLSPSGKLSNDVDELNNYSSTLPVDEFKLLFTWPILGIKNNDEPTWSFSTAAKKRLAQFRQLEENTTVSVGATVAGITADAAGTFGMGWENSSSMSWGEEIQFSGGYKREDDDYRCYKVTPYAYMATAKTLAGATYQYWELDYYVPYKSWGCPVMDGQDH